MLLRVENKDQLAAHLREDTVKKQLRIAEIQDLRLTPIQAGAMKHAAHLTDLQFKTVAASVNQSVPPSVKYNPRQGGIIPNLDPIKSTLESTGLKLRYDDLIVTTLNPCDSVIDLCDSEDEGASELPSCDNSVISSKPLPRKVVYVAKPMETLIKAELEDIFRIFPSCAHKILHPKASLRKPDSTVPVIDIVLQLDNTSLTTFDGTSSSFEMCVIRLILPGISTPQQSHFSCIPLFLFEGDEKYEYIQTMLAQLIGESNGGLSDCVNVDTALGTHAIKVVWHLCSDMKLVAIVLGFRAGGTYPCPFCCHTRSMGIAGPSPPRKPHSLMGKVVSLFDHVLEYDAQLEAINRETQKKKSKACAANKENTDQANIDALGRDARVERQERRTRIRAQRDQALENAFVLLRNDSLKASCVLTALNDATVLQNKLPQIVLSSHFKRVVPDTEAGLCAARELCMAYAIVQTCQFQCNMLQTAKKKAVEQHTRVLTQLLETGRDTEYIDRCKEMDKYQTIKDKAIDECESGMIRLTVFSIVNVSYFHSHMNVRYYG